jgi:ferritin-like metal-binding protein YciE
MLLEKFDTPSELFTYKLGSALTMERDVLEMLGKLEQEARSQELKQQFRHHAEETRQQIDNVEHAFAALGEEPDGKPCPVIEAIDKEGRAHMKRSDESLVDSVILAGAAATEHHEIAVYEWLICEAEAMGKQSVVALFEQNLEQEQHTLEEVKGAMRRITQETAQGVI